MTQKTIITAFIACALFGSCSGLKNENNNQNETAIVTSEEKEIPFIFASNWVVKQNLDSTQLTKLNKITSQTQFDELIGATAFMGEKGKPSSIDFTKQYVIALVGTSSDKLTTETDDSIDIISFKQKDKINTLRYTIKEGVKLSYSIFPSKIIIVDKQYDGEIELIREK